MEVVNCRWELLASDRGSLISASVVRGEVFSVECSVPPAMAPGSHSQLSDVWSSLSLWLALLSILLMRHSCPDIADIHTGLSFPHTAGIIACQQPAEWSRLSTLTLPHSPCPTSSRSSDQHHTREFSSSASVPRVPAKYNASPENHQHLSSQCKKPGCRPTARPLLGTGLLAE